MKKRLALWVSLAVLLTAVITVQFTSQSRASTSARPPAAGLCVDPHSTKCFIITADGGLYVRDLAETTAPRFLGNYWEPKRIDDPRKGHSH